MMVLGSERDKRIAELKLREGVLRLTRGEPAHPALEPWCQKLAYSTEPEDFAPTGLEVVPLWEDESSITGFFVDEASQRTFIVYDIEYIDEVTRIGADPDSVIRRLLKVHVEAEDMASVAASLGYTLEELALSSTS